MNIEFDLHQFKHNRRYWIALAVLVGLTALILLGRQITPAGERVFSWQEWQVFQARQVYTRELADLTAETSRLSGLLQSTPDPARAQIICDQAVSTADGVTSTSLTGGAARLRTAAQETLNWSIGLVDYNIAAAAVQQAADWLAQAALEVE